MDFKPLRLVLACALRLMNDDLFNQLIYDGRDQLVYFGVFLHSSQKVSRAALVSLLCVYLRLQGGDFLFQRKLFIIIAFGNHHKSFVGELSACVVLVGLGEKAVMCRISKSITCPSASALM